jgi:hypothetical protein
MSKDRVLHPLPYVLTEIGISSSRITWGSSNRICLPLSYRWLNLQTFQNMSIFSDSMRIFESIKNVKDFL